MFTIRYKNSHIHGHFDRDAVTIQTPANDLIKCKSMHSAKCRITRLLTLQERTKHP